MAAHFSHIKRPLERITSPPCKKSRTDSGSSLHEYNFSIIGQPCVFPDGIAVNYTYSRSPTSADRARDVSILAKSESNCHKDLSSEAVSSCHRNFAHREPIPYQPSVTPSSQSSSELPPRHRRPRTSYSQQDIFTEVFEKASTVLQNSSDLYGSLDKTVYEEPEPDSLSDSDASLSPERVASPPLGNMSETWENHLITQAVAAHLTSTFELAPTKKYRPSWRIELRKNSPNSILAPRTVDPPLPYDLVRLPESAHNKARRVLLPKGLNQPIITVSMRADIHFFHRSQRHRISAYSLPNNRGYCHVTDAVIQEDTTIIGYGDGPCQISLVHMQQGYPPSLVHIKHAPHTKLEKDATKRGVSCLATNCSREGMHNFFTGGFDKTVRLWSVKDNSTATSECLQSFYSVPDAMAFRSGVLLVGSNRKLLSVDLGHLTAKPSTAHINGNVHHIHIHSQAPNISILEVNNLDNQVQIYDERIQRSWGRAPDCQFGYRCEVSPPSRHSRGATSFTTFVKGYADGCVCIWDYRNSKYPVCKAKHQMVTPINHAIFDDSNIICYGKHNLAFLNNLGS